MEKLHTFFPRMSVFFVMLASVPVVLGTVPAPPELTKELKSKNFQEAASALVSRIDTIQNTKLSTEIKTSQIAVLTAQAIDALGDRSKPVLGDMVGTLNADALSAVTASTVIVTGTKSPAIIKQMTDGLGEFSEKLSVINTAASDPGVVLDKSTLEQIAPPVVTREKIISKITVDPSASRYEGQE